MPQKEGKLACQRVGKPNSDLMGLIRAAIQENSSAAGFLPSYRSTQSLERQEAVLALREFT